MPDRINSGEIITGNQQKPLFSFGIVSDAQYADYEQTGTRFYRSSATKLREAMASLKKDSASFVINLGDVIDRDYSSYKPVMDIIDSSGVKVYHVVGNHDYSVDNRMKKRIPVLTPSKEGFYSFSYHKFRFIILNGNEISTYVSSNKTSVGKAVEYLAMLKNEGAVNALDWNGGISSKQIVWLTQQLDEAVINKEKVFLVCHFPVVPENQHNLLNYKEIIPILEKYHNIIAWLNGHNHTGNYGNFNMIHFVTFKGMVETESDNSFALIEVYRNKIWIKGEGREKSQILAY
jgi:manganese-dependent ADP-ribose/CDP-alcohol diphosphatase